MKNLKIAIWHNLIGGGAKRALYYQAKGLVERGHVVETWCPDTADLDYLPLDEFGKRHVLEFPPDCAPSLVGKLAPELTRTIKRIEGVDAHCAQCAEQINGADFDVLLAYPCFFLAVSSIGRQVNLPSVLYLQEPCRRLYEALPRLPWVAPDASESKWWTPRQLKRTISNMIGAQGLRIQAREELKNVKAYGKVLVNSLFSRESLLRAYGIESHVCYLGIDTDLFKPGNEPRENFVLGMGGLFPVKRPDRVIRALASIPENGRPEFVWVGHFAGEEYVKEMKGLADSLSVVFTPKIDLPDEEVVAHLRRAKAMVYTPQLEPFGFAPLEANACGTPVVAIAEGGVRETVKDGVNGLLVYGDDPAELGNAIKRLIDDEVLWARLSQNTRQHVMQNWKWEDSIDQLERHLAQPAPTPQLPARH